MFSMVMGIAFLILLVCACWEMYTADKCYDEYKKTGDVMKFHRSVFLLLKAIITLVIIT